MLTGRIPTVAYNAHGLGKFRWTSHMRLQLSDLFWMRSAYRAHRPTAETKKARWPILNFVFFAKFRMGILMAMEIESKSATRKRDQRREDFAQL